MAYGRKPRRVTWKDPEARVPQLRPHPFMSSTAADTEVTENFVAGSLWRLTRNMVQYIPDPRVQKHDAPYAISSWALPPELPAGTVAMCLGSIRVTESRHDGRPVEVLRHAFLAGGRRYMIIELTALESLSPTLNPE